MWDAILNFITSDAAGSMFVLAITGIIGVILKLKSIKKWKLERLVEFTQIAVVETYQTYVKVKKDGHEWGAEEKKEARNRALGRLKELCTEQGGSLLKFYAKEYLPILIEKVLNATKAEGSLPDPLSLGSDGPELG